MRLFRTQGEKARTIVHKAASDSRILTELAGNNRYVAVTSEAVYVGSVGVSSGFFFGKKVKTYPIDAITAVDVRKSLFLVQMEITMGGTNEISSVLTGFLRKAANENVITFAKRQYKQVEDLATAIRKLRTASRQPLAGYQQQTGGQGSIVHRLRELENLRNNQMVTDAEYAQMRNKILDNL